MCLAIFFVSSSNLLPPDACNSCPKKFTTASTLRSHVRIHTEEKPFECGECGRCFSQNNHLSSHRERVHASVAEDKPFSCQICPKAFASRNGLMQHHRVHPQAKPAPCDFCLEGFDSTNELIQHITMNHVKLILV